MEWLGGKAKRGERYLINTHIYKLNLSVLRNSADNTVSSQRVEVKIRCLILRGLCKQCLCEDIHGYS